MGQGNYVAVVYGMTGELPYDEKNEDYPEWLNKAMRGSWIDTSYESKTRWMGVVVGVTDLCVVRSEGTMTVEMEYDAFPVESLVEWLESKSPGIMEKASSDWRQLQFIARAHDFDLPDGRLLLVFDYD